MELSVRSPQIWVWREPVDFRKAIDGLCEVVTEAFGEVQHSSVYVFFNRGRDRLKVLAWHGNGFMLLYKRLEQGYFRLPGGSDSSVTVNEQELSWLLAGLDWQAMRDWKTLEYREFC